MYYIDLFLCFHLFPLLYSLNIFWPEIVETIRNYQKLFSYINQKHRKLSEIIFWKTGLNQKLVSSNLRFLSFGGYQKPENYNRNWFYENYEKFSTIHQKIVFRNFLVSGILTKGKFILAMILLYKLFLTPYTK